MRACKPVSKHSSCRAVRRLATCAVLAVACIHCGSDQPAPGPDAASGGALGSGGKGAGGASAAGGSNAGGSGGKATGGGGTGAVATGGATGGSGAGGGGGSARDGGGSDGAIRDANDSGADGRDARTADAGGTADTSSAKDTAMDRAVDPTDGGTVGPPPAEAGSLVNGIQWADTSGKPIQAHGGGIIQVDGYYYWFGENRNPDGTFYAVSCYRSADLVHWEFRNDVLTSSSGSGLKPANVERPKVVYNASTKKYVMWMHWENGSDYGEARAAVASCATVDGDYTYHGSARPMVNGGVTDHGKPGYMSRDCTLFVDSDGKGYFLSASNENYDLNLYRLTDDYLAVDSLAAVLFKGGHREAPALWKRDNVYFLLTSAATGWDPNQAQYATSTSLASGWSSMKNVGDSTTFHSQSTYVLPVQGRSGTAYLYMGDRWAGAWGGPVNDSTYVWLPITFPSSTSMSMSWNNTVTIDASAGTVTAATNRFKLLNKASGKALSIEGGSTAEGGDAVQMPYTGANDQEWSLNYDGEGYFKLTNAKSSLVLDVVSSSTSDGATIDQWTDNGGDNQKWRLVDKGSGMHQLLNKRSKKVAEVASGATADGAAVVQRTAAGGDNQPWELLPAD